MSNRRSSVASQLCSLYNLLVVFSHDLKNAKPSAKLQRLTLEALDAFSFHRKTNEKAELQESAKRSIVWNVSDLIT